MGLMKLQLNIIRKVSYGSPKNTGISGVNRTISVILTDIEYGVCINQ